MVFDFERFPVYKLALEFSKDVDALLSEANIPKNSRVADQLIRASLSIALNIAEGAGRFHKADKNNFYIMARGSAFESVAVLDILKAKNVISEQQQNRLYTMLEEISKMLAGLINSQK
jgi:four helix bundle protein